MKIISGKFKNSTIKLKKKINFSPTSSYLREVIFDVFNSIWSWDDKAVVDLFAGTGLLGIEALSRGCKLAYFNDISKENIRNIESFLQSKCDNYSAFNMPFQQFLLSLAQRKQKIDLVFIDPPFISPEMIKTTLTSLRKNEILNDGGYAVVISKNFVTHEDKSWTVVRNKKYGQKFLTLWRYQPAQKNTLPKSDSKFVLVSGASGVGKTKIIDQLVADPTLNLNYSVSYTTRKKRPQEIPNKNYVFISKQKFLEMRDQSAFYEYAKFNNEFYGTAKEQIADFVRQNKNVLLETELIGAEILKKQLEPIYWVYILPPKVEKLRSRLQARQTETSVDQTNRINKSIDEIKYVLHNKLFDVCVINQEIPEAAQQIKDFLLKKGFGQTNK